MRAHYRDGGLSIELYDVRHADDRGKVFEGDVAFFLGQARRTGGPILELGCGTGRVAIPLAGAGFDVTGLDLSPHMLRIARRKSAAVRFVRGSMERFRLGRRFRLILIPFRAFQHLLTPEAQRRCLMSVREHLAPGGRFIVDLFDPRLEYCLPQGPKAGVVRDSIVHPETGRRFRVVVRDRINDPFRQTFRETWDWTERDSKGRVVRRVRDELSLRWTYRWEMRYLLELCGFRVLACHGDFRGDAARYGAEQIWVAT
ncbi:MAG: class I SAM-dependent methyltransferase [Planctomycetes bacterium]|nr:class I SAM-dependent methyltransferase [Planctomycetota bacterium]